MKYLSFLLLSLLVFASCKKDHHTPPPANKENLLVSKTWQVQRLTSSQSSIIIFYERGGQNNTHNFDNDYLKFEKGGTGQYTTGSIVYDITWQFTNSDQTEMLYTIHNYADGNPHPDFDMDVKLENVTLSDTRFRYAEVYTNNNGTEVVSSVYRIPR